MSELQRAEEAIARLTEAMERLGIRGTAIHIELNLLEESLKVARASCMTMGTLVNLTGPSHSADTLRIIPKQAENADLIIMNARAGKISPRSELRSKLADLRECYVKPMLGILQNALELARARLDRPLSLIN